MRLGSAAWPELARRRCMVLVPVGSCEQHGPHLPLHTDTVIASAVAERAADAVGAWQAPAFGYGASGEHQGFPGTLSIGHEALALLLVELGRSAAQWCDRLVFVNGHGGNLPTVARAVRRLRYEGRDVSWLPCELPGSDAHAGRAETSLMLHLDRASVRLAAAQPGATAPLADLLPELRAGGVRAVSPNGVLGDPTGADAAEGARMLDRLVADAVGRISAGRVDDLGRLVA